MALGRGASVALLSGLFACGGSLDDRIEGSVVATRSAALVGRRVALGDTPAGSIKIQRADVIPVGPEHFVVGWLGGDPVMRYARYDTGAAAAAPAVAAGAGGAELEFAVRVLASATVALAVDARPAGDVGLHLTI